MAAPPAVPLGETAPAPRPDDAQSGHASAETTDPFPVALPVARGGGVVRGGTRPREACARGHPATAPPRGDHPVHPPSGPHALTVRAAVARRDVGPLRHPHPVAVRRRPVDPSRAREGPARGGPPRACAVAGVPSAPVTGSGRSAGDGRGGGMFRWASGPAGPRFHTPGANRRRRRPSTGSAVSAAVESGVGRRVVTNRGDPRAAPVEARPTGRPAWLRDDRAGTTRSALSAGRVSCCPAPVGEFPVRGRRTRVKRAADR